MLQALTWNGQNTMGPQNLIKLQTMYNRIQNYNGLVIQVGINVDGWPVYIVASNLNVSVHGACTQSVYVLKLYK